MSNSIAPGSSADVNVKVTALTTNPNVPVTYKTIILKKNLVNGVNTLTQEMMSAQNTKYVIKYDYVLGEDITVPANCVFQFDGGSITNASGNSYSITGNNTYIEAGLVKIFSTDVTLAGTWNVAEGYALWFGGNTSATINKAITSLKGCCININGNWTFDEQIVVPYNTSLRCDFGVMNVPTSITQGTLMKFYCSRLNHYLSNFIIYLNVYYANSSCIEVFGVSNALKNLGIEGFDNPDDAYSDPVHINLATEYLYFPMIIGGPRSKSIINNVTGYKFHALESSATAESEGSIVSIFYDKNIFINATDLWTVARFLEDTGCNGNRINISSRWCQNGISLYQEFTPSVIVNLGYQTNSLYPGKVISIDSDRYKPVQQWTKGPVYNLHCADIQTGVKIDNNPNATYNFDDDNADNLRHRLFTTGNTIYDNRLDLQQNNNNVGAIPIIYTSFLKIEQMIGDAQTHIDAVKNLLTYLVKLNITKPVYIESYNGWIKWGEDYTKLNKLLYEDGDTPLNTSDDAPYCLKIKIPVFNSSNTLYRRFVMSYENLDKGIRYEIAHNTTWNTDKEITGVEVRYKRITSVSSASTSSTRPTLDSRGIGFCMFDTSLGKPIYWNGSKWIKSDGTDADA